MMKIDILILNYNGKGLLEAFLPSVRDAAKRSSNICKVHVIDNVSSDGSMEFLKNNFPEINVIRAKANRVLFSYNDIVRQLDSDIVIFLNNDIRVKEDFVDPLAGHFVDDKVFFVAPCVLNMDGTFNGGRSHFEFKLGIIKSVVESDSYNKAGETQMISCGAFRRDMFLELGGFDDLYYPGIWEDADICYRGLKSCLKGVYEPRSIIWHDESTTFKKVYGNREKMTLAHRNMFLFMWKNITDAKMIFAHIIMLAPVLAGAIIKNNTEFVSGFFRALYRLGPAISRRGGSLNKNGCVLKDRDLILKKSFK
jgi:GT2 family glycosyltransferase